MTNSLILIPARLAATRLPRKPLADICGLPMIVHVAKRASEANLGPVVIATDAEEIADCVKAHGFDAVLTRADHPSGSDRIAEAIHIVDPKGLYNRIINVQGDLPTIDPEIIARAGALLDDSDVDIATLAALITREDERNDPNVVKVVGTPLDDAATHLRALYFTRATAPHGDGPLYHHIGLYAYRRDALMRFVNFPPSQLEQREKLEQLRALENMMRIDVGIVDTVPHGVDTPEHLERARQIIAERSE